MKEKDLKYDVTAWREAYEENVRKILGYVGFYSKSTDLEFAKIQATFPEANPWVFMQAVFPPYTTWNTYNKGEWKPLKYPYPKMLCGEKAVKAYDKAIRRGLTTAVSTSEQVLTAVENSLERLKQCKVDLHRSEVLWDMYLMGIVSPFLILVAPGMQRWIQGKVRKQEITLEEYNTLQESEKVMMAYTSLLPKLYKLVGANA